MRDNTRQDRYWNQMQRLGGTLSHLLKEVFARCSPLTCSSAAAVSVQSLPSQCCSGPLHQAHHGKSPLQVPLSGLDTSPVEIQLVKPLPTQKIGRWKSYHPMSAFL